MLSNSENCAALALQELMDVARLNHNYEDMWLYALTWLAACRLTPADNNGGATGINDLLARQSWDRDEYSAIPFEAKQLVWGSNADLPSKSTARTHALSVVTKLIEQSAGQAWDVIDAPWQLAGSARVDFFGGLVLAPELCELLFSRISADYRAKIWIPFDVTGQLVIRAVRKGFRVVVTDPGGRSQLHIKLLLAIEQKEHDDGEIVKFEVSRENNNRELTAEYLIATPPIGMRRQTGAGWRQWEGVKRDQIGSDSFYQRHGPSTQVQLDRSDSWAIAAFWPRISRRAVFLVSQSVLFAKGQEQRLRENLLLGEGALSAVTLLPTRQMSSSSMASAMIQLDWKKFDGKVRFTDATDMTVESKSTMKFARVLNLNKVISLLDGDREDAKTSVTADFKDIAIQDFNLVPARYLRQSLTGPRRPLRDLVEVIRAPVASKDVTALTIQEAGFPELDGWREVSGPFSKTTSINARKLEESMLRAGDILLSIKGTLGKSALVGNVPTVEPSYRHDLLKLPGEEIPADIAARPVVLSQSCIALRVVAKEISPLHLFLYLRSDDFKSQIDSLRVGASVAHVTPTTLLQEIRVPIPEDLELDAYAQRYNELCDLEASIEAAQQQTTEIRQSLWPVSVDARKIC
jgi:type I restriction-modification system DNA methylase subunit